MDDIGNLEDLLRIVFIHEECWNLKVFVDGGELTRNVNTDRCPLKTNVEYCESVR